jgi:hypothetical protein
MNIFSKAALIGTLGAALAAGTMSSSALAYGVAIGPASSGSWSIALADYEPGANPDNPIYLGPGQTWSGNLTANSNGEIKYYNPRANGALGAQLLACDSGGTAAVTATVNADGSFRITCD